MTLSTRYEYPEAKAVVVCGDIHGKFDELVYRALTLHGMTDTLVIVAGDCGFGFHKRGYYTDVYNRSLPKLEKANCWLAFVRGNHDNPVYFYEKEVSAARFRTIPDYAVLSACGHNVLCVGGATSVDRANRENFIQPEVKVNRLYETAEMRKSIEHMNYVLRFEPADYWPNEQPYFDVDALEAIWREGKTVDAVVSHVSPSMCEDVTPPHWLEYLIERDPTLPADMKADRETMDALLHRLVTDGHPLRHWFYGHYHHSWQADIGGVNYTMLNIMEMKELR